MTRLPAFLSLLTLLAAAACTQSSSGTSGADNDIGDGAAPQAPVHPPLTPPRPSGPPNFQLTVRDPFADDRALVAGAPVVFSGPDGAVFDETTTDADGRAAGHVEPGDTVSAVLHRDDGTNAVLTVVGIQPGDDLPLGASRPRTLGSFEVTLPANPDAVTYEVYGPCGRGESDTPEVTIEIASDCALDPMSLYGFAYDGASTALGWVSQSDVPYVDGGSTTLTGAWQGFDRFDTLHVDVGNVPPDLLSSIRYTAVDLRGYPSELSLEGTLSGDLAVAPGSSGVISTWLFDAAPGHETGQQLFHAVDDGDTSYALDAATMIHEWLQMPAFDPANGMLTIGATGAGEYDGYESSLHFPATGAQTLVWRVDSATRGPIRLPVLPADVGTAPRPGDVLSYANVMAVQASGGSWDQLRADLPDGFDAEYRTRQGDVLFGWTAY